MRLYDSLFDNQQAFIASQINIRNMIAEIKGEQSMTVLVQHAAYVIEETLSCKSGRR